MKIQETILSPSQREGILRDIWIAHDGRWFLKSAGKLGFDVATQLNLKATKSFRKTEIRRLFSEIGEIEIKCIEDLDEIQSPLEGKVELFTLAKNVRIVGFRSMISFLNACFRF